MSADDELPSAFFVEDDVYVDTNDFQRPEIQPTIAAIPAHATFNNRISSNQQTQATNIIEMCKCVPPTVARVEFVRSDTANKGKPYYKCGNFPYKDCKFFKWVNIASTTANASAPLPAMPSLLNSSASFKRSRPDESSDALREAHARMASAPIEVFNANLPAQATASSSYPQNVPPNCSCIPPTAGKLCTSKKENANKGRQFYSCELSYGTPGRCNFFQWADLKEVFPPQAREEVSTNDMCRVPHSLDSTGESAKRGYAAEAAFEAAAMAHGYTVTRTSELVDVILHVDFLLKKGPCQEVWQTVDVKAAKKRSRGDLNVQYEYVWLELHGVHSNCNGYLIDGWATHIAFELEQMFLVVDRRALLQWACKKLEAEKQMHIDGATGAVQPTHIVTRPEEAIYKCYQREGRHDIVTLASVDDIRQSGVPCYELPKGNP